jgi:hypothetical protein
MAGTSIYSGLSGALHEQLHKKRIVKKTTKIDVERARVDFAYFCDVVGDKPPAVTIKNGIGICALAENSECLIGIAGPNIDILAPRGSAKSTVLGLYSVGNWRTCSYTKNL